LTILFCESASTVTLAVPFGATQVCAGPQSCDGEQPPQVPPQPSPPQVFPAQSAWQLFVAPPSAPELSAAAPESLPEPPSSELGPPPVDESTDAAPDSGVTEAPWPPPSAELCELSELLQAAAASAETTTEARRTEKPLMKASPVLRIGTHRS
jgi:hypothetical protein